MSEYQYYEFLAIDQPLTGKQIDAVRRFSTRAEITATSFTNEYNWGDFRGDPYHFLEKYFDAMLYFANWGTHRFMFRVPTGLLDLKIAKQYCGKDSTRFRHSADYLIFDWDSRDDSGEDWEETPGSMAALAPIRAEVLGGDLRPLYLAWLLTLQSEDVADNHPEPPVPPGLAKLTGPQKALADFLRIDQDLLAVAASQSPPAEPASGQDMADWIASLPVAEKDALLLSASEGKTAYVQTRLRQQFVQAQSRAGRTALPPATGRTAGQLLELARQTAQQRQAQEAERQAKAQARHQAQAAAARAKHLDSLAGKEDRLWRQVQEAVATRQPQGYQQAVTLLTDLRDLALRTDSTKAFTSQVRQLRQLHAKKGNFLKLLDKAALTMV